MTVTLDTGEWNDDGDAWSPSTGENPGGFIVTVESATGSGCGPGQPAEGKAVDVLYSDGTVVTFKAAGLNKKTKVRPKTDLRKVSPPVLEYGRAGDKGYITGIEVTGGGTPWKCQFANRDALSVINITPMPNKRSAQ